VKRATLQPAGFDVQDRRKDLFGLATLQAIEVPLYRAGAGRSSVKANLHAAIITNTLSTDKPALGRRWVGQRADIQVVARLRDLFSPQVSRTPVEMALTQ
jgi:hypothetical protein